MWVQSGRGLWLCLSDVWRVHWCRLAGSLGLSSLSGVVPLWWCVPSSHRGIFPAGTGRNRAKMNFYLVCLGVFSVILETTKCET